MNLRRAPLPAKASLLVLALFALVAIFADLIVSPTPLAARIDGHWTLLPALSARAPLELGPRDWALWAPVRPSSAASNGPEPARHVLGTDARGRDVLAVTIRGTRTLVVTSLALIAVALTLGTALGWYAAFGSPLWDAVLARLVEAIGVFPTPVLVALAALAAPSHRIVTLIAVLGALRGLEIARLLRADLLIAQRDPSFEASRLLTLAQGRRVRQWLVRAAPAVLLSAAFAVASLVAIDAGLTHVGLPVDAAHASWGALLGETGLRGQWLAGLGVVVFTGCLFTLADAARRQLRMTPSPRSRQGVAVPAERST